MVFRSNIHTWFILYPHCLKSGGDKYYLTNILARSAFNAIISMVSHWEFNGFSLRTQWFLVEISMVSHWDSMVSRWELNGFSLRFQWFLAENSMVSCWESIGTFMTFHWIVRSVCVKRWERSYGLLRERSAFFMWEVWSLKKKMFCEKTSPPNLT